MILYNELTGNRLTDAGAIDRTTLKISYDVYASWPVKFVEEDGVTAVDVSDATAWKASIDDDFDHSSEVMARTLDAGIDSSQAADGIIAPVLDTYTAEYLAAVGTIEKITAYFELRGFNAEGKVVHECRFSILAYNTIDPEGESELDPPSDDASKTWAEAILVKRDFSGYGTKTELADNDTALFNNSADSGNPIVVTCLKIWNYIKGKADAVYAAITHAHIIGDVTGLQTALDGKQDALGFTPADSAITVNGYALTENITLDADDLADGTTNAVITLTQETNFETA
ncbi:MAG: hypothetical protein PHV82_14125, partial [Victivallaceae bacterium]|nr:hypothetical protein [Victivallaceae bacterium]